MSKGMGTKRSFGMQHNLTSPRLGLGLGLEKDQYSRSASWSHFGLTFPEAKNAKSFVISQTIENCKSEMSPVWCGLRLSPEKRKTSYFDQKLGKVKNDFEVAHLCVNRFHLSQTSRE